MKSTLKMFLLTPPAVLIVVGLILFGLADNTTDRAIWFVMIAFCMSFLWAVAQIAKMVTDVTEVMISLLSRLLNHAMDEEMLRKINTESGSHNADG